MPLLDGHGHMTPPPFEALLTDDPDLWLVTAKLHDPCSGDCEALCTCDRPSEELQSQAGSQ